MAAKKTPLEKLNEILGKHNSSLVTTLGAEDDLTSDVKIFLPTGNMPLDIILGGGWPIGRAIEVFGHEASGKSMLGALACAQAMKCGWPAFYLDTEFAVDTDFFKRLGRQVGVDMSSLYYISPDSLDDVFTTYEAALEFKKQQYSQETPMVFVWDSVASTIADDEKKKGWEDRGYSKAAPVISAAFRRIRGTFSAHNTLFFMINQTRTNVGVLFGPSYTTYGGGAPKFYATIRLMLDEEGKAKVGEKGERKRVIGSNIRASVVKNKVATPFREALLPFSYLDLTIDEAAGVLAMMKQLGLVTVGGGGTYKATISVLGEVTFKAGDVKELVAEYGTELQGWLNDGWLRMPAAKALPEDLEPEDE